MAESNGYKTRGLIIVLLAISFISSNITIIYMKLHSNKINIFFDLVGESNLTALFVAFITLILGANYYLKDRLTTGKEDLFLLVKGYISLSPILILSVPGVIENIISNEQTWLAIFYIVICTISFFVIYLQLFKLGQNIIKKYLTIVVKADDRLTIAITVIGLIISLIALFK